ncbi:hypothetical protein ACVIU7_001106 [Bradyrhizobium liaoningense]
MSIGLRLYTICRRFPDLADDFVHGRCLLRRPGNNSRSALGASPISLPIPRRSHTGACNRASRTRCGRTARRCRCPAWHRRGRTARQRCGASNDSGPAWLSRRRRALGTARLVSLAGRRRDRRRRSDRFRDSRDCSGVGGCRTRARNVLVLYRSLTHPGLLGLLPVTAKRMGRHHVAGRDRSSSSG